MKKVFFMLVLSLVVMATAQAQKVGKLELKAVSNMSEKKFKKAPKRVYIAEFFVNYQLAFSQTSMARGGREVGGGYRGSAKATLNVSVAGVDMQELQKLTDELYKQYTDRLTSEGYEIVTADEAGATDLFSEWERKKGGDLSQAQFPGYLGTAPTGFEYFVKRVNKKGREKRGLMDYAVKLSPQMDGVIIAKVNLAVPFIEGAEGGASKALRGALGGVAKVVVKPNLRLAKSEAVQIGKMGSASVYSKSNFFFKASLKDQAAMNLELKKDVEIDGVFEEKKYKASKAANTDNWGSSAGHFRVFHFTDEEIERTQPVACDGGTYMTGVRQVTTAFIEAALNEFISVAKG